jgi:DNA-binding beta-propeller fold protein YncE
MWPRARLTPEPLRYSLTAKRENPQAKKQGENAMTPVQDRRHSICGLARLSRTIGFFLAAALTGASALPRTGHAGDIPAFTVDASWPKPLPNNWIIGQVGGIAVDSEGHIWITHRPRSLTDDEKGATLTPPRSKCCASAPPVLELDADGNLLRSWGGPGEGYEWVGREHGIEVDDKGFVWLTGNADNDNAVLKFTADGKFVMQIGKIAPTKGSNDTTQLGKPAEISFDKDANELYVADGYGNRRVIVFDATTGAYKRGAYGNPPNDDKQAVYDPKAPVSQQFGNPVHCVKIAHDGLVYVCDRINNRIQVFKKDGTFVKEWFYEKNTLGNGAVWDIAVWPDPKQTYLLSADGENNEIRILKREDGTVVGSFGRNGRNAGQFHWVHAMAVDAKGNVYTGEVDTGKRIQKFKLTSDALR